MEPVSTRDLRTWAMLVRSGSEDWAGVDARADHQIKLCERAESAADHIDALESGVERLLDLLQCYSWQQDDEELEAVNTLRRFIGWRNQLPKHLEVELQADEAEERS